MKQKGTVEYLSFAALFSITLYYIEKTFQKPIDKRLQNML